MEMCFFSFSILHFRLHSSSFPLHLDLIAIISSMAFGFYGVVQCRSQTADIAYDCTALDITQWWFQLRYKFHLIVVAVCDCDGVLAMLLTDWTDWLNTCYVPHYREHNCQHNLTLSRFVFRPVNLAEWFAYRCRWTWEPIVRSHSSLHSLNSIIRRIDCCPDWANRFVLCINLTNRNHPCSFRSRLPI